MYSAHPFGHKQIFATSEMRRMGLSILELKKFHELSLPKSLYLRKLLKSEALVRPLPTSRDPAAHPLSGAQQDAGGRTQALGCRVVRSAVLKAAAERATSSADAAGSVAFSWYRLPQYAARLVKAAVDRLGEHCVVVGSRPSVPVEGMERALGQRVHWIDADRPVSWRDLGLDVPAIYIQSGWAYPAFSALGREVKSHGGRIIGLADANWRGDFRQIVLGPLMFRALHRRHFDAMIVPGLQGERLMRYFGIPTERIRKGMYGADPAIFNGGPPLASRPRTFLFVGQFIARKDVLGLSRAFLRFSETRPGWTLRICGSGPQRDEIPSDPRIVVENFVQPEQLALRYHEARFFVLPSLFEAWGLVVHEAALCGCALLLSDAIGSADDLASARNAMRFKPRNEDVLVRALDAAADRDAAWLEAAEVESRALAAQFGPDRFATEVAGLVAGLRGAHAALRNV